MSGLDQSPKVDERRWLLANVDGRRLVVSGNTMLPLGERVEVLPASLVDHYRDAVAEIAEALNHSDTVALDTIAGILANGPLATAPGGPKEDECFRLREQVASLQEEVGRLRDDLAVFKARPDSAAPILGLMGDWPKEYLVSLYPGHAERTCAGCSEEIDEDEQHCYADASGIWHSRCWPRVRWPQPSVTEEGRDGD